MFTRGRPAAVSHIRVPSLMMPAAPGRGALSRGCLSILAGVRGRGASGRRAAGLLLAPLAGCALAALCATAAQASPRELPLPPIRSPGPAAAAPPAPPPDDGLSGDGFYLEADQLAQDQAAGKVTATGHVIARYEGRTVRAAELTYDSATGLVTASGGVTLINPDGSAEFSQTAVLDRGMTQGVATAFSTRLKAQPGQVGAGEVTISAATAVRRSPTFTELNEVLFTPCPVCAKNPTPTWSIRARTAVEDRKREIVYFRNAIIEVHGLPVFYMPVAWQVDPSVNRKSGLLEPTITTSGTRGFSWEQPYLQVISPSEDVVISPQFNTKVNPFLNVDWRKRFYSGAIDVRAGYTYDQDFDSHGSKFGPDTSRSYILAKGLFAIDNNWQWGFTAERVSDPLIFDKYDVSDTFVERGLYGVDDRRLISQIYTTRQDQNSYLSVAAISVQGLRATDIDSTIPTIAPLIEAHYEPSQAIFGGRLRIDASGVVLNRDQSPSDPTQPGIDSRRGTINADWQRSYIFSSGLRLDPFIQGRADFYSLSNLPAPYAKTADITRAFGTAGLDISYPFVKRSGPVTYLLEPLAQIALSPDTQQDPRIPIEDSVDFELDSTNLFQVNKSPGFDLYEGGQRFNLGGRATALWDAGQNLSLLVGRSFRLKPDPNLPLRSGLTTTASDWIFAAEGSPLKGVSFFSRWRMDSATFSLNRLEVGVDVTTGRMYGSLRYLEEAEDTTGAPVKDLDFSWQYMFTQHWGVAAYGAREFTSGAWRDRQVGLVYRDDCLRVEVLYHEDDTFNSTLGPSSGITLRLSLATSGNSVYSPTSSSRSP
jgi:LPS-assembly protein